MMSAMIKFVAGRFPVGEVVFFRSTFALVVLVAWLSSRGEFPTGLRTKRPFGHVGRSIAGSGGMFAGFIALSLLPLADAAAFTFATPLIVVALAALVLGETVRIARWSAVSLGFVGVMVMLSEHLGEGFRGHDALSPATFGSLVALAGAGFTAVALIQTRRLTRSEATGAIVFYFSSLTALAGALLLLVAALWPDRAPGAVFMKGEAFVTPSAIEAILLASIGVFGGIGQILMTHSYRYADASIIAAFDYVSMIWALLLGFVVFGEAPTVRILIGAAIVVTSGALALWREHALSRVSSGDGGAEYSQNSIAQSHKIVR